MFPSTRDSGSRSWWGPVSRPSRGRGRGPYHWQGARPQVRLGQVGGLETRSRRNPFDSVVSNISKSSRPMPMGRSSSLAQVRGPVPDSSPGRVGPVPSGTLTLAAVSTQSRGVDPLPVSDRVTTRDSHSEAAIFGATDTDLRPGQLPQSESQVKDASLSLKGFHQQILKMRSGRSLIGKKRPSRARTSPCSHRDSNLIGSTINAAAVAHDDVPHSPNDSVDANFAKEPVRIKSEDGASSCLEQCYVRTVGESSESRTGVSFPTVQSNKQWKGDLQIKVEKDSSEAPEKTLPLPSVSIRPTSDSSHVATDTAVASSPATLQPLTSCLDGECSASATLSVTTEATKVQEGVTTTNLTSKLLDSEAMESSPERGPAASQHGLTSSPCLMESTEIGVVSTDHVPAKTAAGSTLATSTVANSVPAKTLVAAAASPPHKDGSTSHTPYACILPVPRPKLSNDPPPKPPKPVTLEEINNSRRLISAGALVIATPISLQASTSNTGKSTSLKKVGPAAGYPFSTCKRPARLYFCDVCRINCSSENALKIHMKSPLHQKKERAALNGKSQNGGSCALTVPARKPGSEFEVAGPKPKLLKRKDPGSEFAFARDPVPVKHAKNIEGTLIIPGAQTEEREKIIQQGLDGSYKVLPDKATSGESTEDVEELECPVPVESAGQAEEVDAESPQAAELAEDRPYYCRVCMVDCVTPMAFASHTTDLTHREKALQKEIEQSLKAGHNKLQNLKKVTTGNQKINAKMGKIGAGSTFYCKVCELHLPAASEVSHQQGRPHKQNVIKRLRGEPVGKSAAKTKRCTQDAGDGKPEAKIVQAIVDQCEEPLIGLQHVKEVHRKGSDTPWVVCELCQVQVDLQGPVLLRHLLGIRHRTAYINMNYPEYYAEVKNCTFQSRTEKNVMVEEYATVIEAEEGRAKVTAMYTDPSPLATGGRPSKKSKVAPPAPSKAVHAQPDPTQPEYQEFCSQQLKETIADLVKASLQSSMQPQVSRLHSTDQQPKHPKLTGVGCGVRYSKADPGYMPGDSQYPPGSLEYPPGGAEYRQGDPEYSMAGTPQWSEYAGREGYLPSRSADQTVPPDGLVQTPESRLGPFDSGCTGSNEMPMHSDRRHQAPPQTGYQAWAPATGGAPMTIQGCVPAVVPPDVPLSAQMTPSTCAEPGSSTGDRSGSVPASPAKIWSRHSSNSSDEMPSASFTQDLLVEANEGAGLAGMSDGESSPGSEENDQPSASFTLDLLDTKKLEKDRPAKLRKDRPAPKVPASAKLPPRLPFQEKVSAVQPAEQQLGPVAHRRTTDIGIGVPSGPVPHYMPSVGPRGQQFQMPGLPLSTVPPPVGLGIMPQCISVPLVDVSVPPPGFVDPAERSHSSPAVLPTVQPQLGFVQPRVTVPLTGPPPVPMPSTSSPQPSSHASHQLSPSCSVQQGGQIALPPRTASAPLGCRSQVSSSAKSVMTSMEDAELALKVSEALAQALKNYKLQQKKREKK